MKASYTTRSSFSLLLYFLFSFSAWAQTYQLTVQNGYGSGLYAAGDTVHIWAQEWPFTKTFSHWTGQTLSLEMPDEWHTRLIMPAHPVTVTANTRDLPPGADFTEEHLMGRDTIQRVFYYFPPGGPPKGMVWLFHGTNGSAEGWVTGNIEHRLFANYLMADTLAVISIECEERTRNTDFSGDGNIRWDYTGDTVANVDIANIRAIRDTFIHRGWINWTTPQIAEGFSAGGAFSTLVAPFLDWKVALNHNTSGVTPVIEQTHTPILFSMTLFDNHPEVGLAGNIEAYENYQYLIDKGNCARFYMLRPSPAYPERFMRVPGVSALKSLGVFNELQANDCLNAKNYVIKNPDEIAVLVAANPQNWPTLLSLSIQQRNYVSDELQVMMALHHFHTDFNAKDLRFIRYACAGAVATHEPGQPGLAKIFPNPATGNIRLPANSNTIKIFDPKGRVLLEKNITGNPELDVSSLPTGLYFLEIQADGFRQLARLIKV